ncbi:hypothetical protein [Actinoallomurus iriomotensis]|uniref:Uncharacterized protein n=1 Tax=Actinoallomurus iriomotensis TaxID=478107 RepID=A0A9W6VPN5_9ACTN|nr:hypothetical protein [Actinoallomurus iriomotensis]GLY73776.1 hypothetical protein Airi01_020430 [Actinoallomurus iriomotensis]
MSVEPIPRREVVTRSPNRPRKAPVSPPVSAARAAVHEDPRLHSLMRRQLRSSLVGVVALAVPTALLPLLLVLAPASGGIRSGPGLTWLILGFACYPPLVLLGWWYVRRAERHERDFARRTEGD